MFVECGLLCFYAERGIFPQPFWECPRGNSLDQTTYKELSALFLLELSRGAGGCGQGLPGFFSSGVCMCVLVFFFYSINSPRVLSFIVWSHLRSFSCSDIFEFSYRPGSFLSVAIKCDTRLLRWNEIRSWFREGPKLYEVLQSLRCQVTSEESEKVQQCPLQVVARYKVWGSSDKAVWGGAKWIFLLVCS